MIRKLKISVILLAVLTTALQAQNSRIMYFMNLPQSRYMNPAIRPIDSVYVGLPAISGISFAFNNNFINFSDVIMKGRSDSLITFLHPDYKTSDFLKKIKKVNFIEPEMMVQLFALGFRTNKGYVSFNVNERVAASLSFPGDLVELALKGNGSFAGKYIDLSALRASATWYREVGLGYAWNINHKLRAGVKGKVLLGIMSASIKNNSFGITVNQDYSHVFDADITTNISAPLRIMRDENNKISDLQSVDEGMKNAVLLRGSKNMGLGLDLGATYEFTEKIMLSAALTDIGFIKWKNNVSNLTTKSSFEFTGLDMTNVINGDKTMDDLGSDLADSLKTVFTPSETHQSFKTFVPTTLNLAGSYQVTNYLNLGVLSSTRLTGKQMHESFTMSANVNLRSILLASMSYTAANHSFSNIGAGIALRLAYFQFYMTADRLPLTWNKIVSGSGRDQSSVVLPSNWNTIDMRFGMNLVFGRHRKPKIQQGDNMVQPEQPKEQPVDNTEQVTP